MAEAAVHIQPSLSEEVETPPLASVKLPESQNEPQLPESNPAPVDKASVSVIEKEGASEPTPLTAESVTISATTKETQQPAQPSSLSPQESELNVEKEQPDEAKHVEKRKVPESIASFKEESNKVSDLSDSEGKTLEDLRILVQESLDKRIFEVASSSDTSGLPEEVFIWGVPLMKDERTDVILLKFLRARDFKVKNAFSMLKNTIKWRKEFNVDELVKEDLGNDLEKVVFMHGHDKEGHPVCYNVYGEFQNKELYAKTLSDEEKRFKFLRWRIQFLEKSIRNLDFYPGGINTIFQVNDLRNSPGPGKMELRIATKQALQILQDNYPEFVAKQVFINVPWWHMAFYMMISSFLTHRTKSKFVFASPSRTADVLFKYVSPEQVPIQYGGLSVDLCECNPEFTLDDRVEEVIVKPATKKTVEIIVSEKCTLIWELRVVGWEVSCDAEFVPNDERGYTVIIQKTRKMTPSDEPVVSNSFNISELGKILLIIDNPTAKKKKLLYRFKVVPYLE